MTKKPNKVTHATVGRFARRRFLAGGVALAGSWMLPRALRGAQTGGGLDAEVIVIGAGPGGAERGPAA